MATMSPEQKAPDSYELLSTKLVPPQPRAPLIVREQLLARLDEGLDHKLTLISAPAGFGKTTLASEWIAQGRERGNLPPIAWVSLDAADNDPVRFWRYVLHACRAFGGDASEAALALLRYSAQPPFEVLLTRFINKIAALSGKVVLALEDYHAITSPQIHETLATLHALAQKAGHWYEQEGMLAEATEAALTSGDKERAAALIERTIAPRLVQNEFHTLRRWMEQLPDEVLAAHPNICMPFATAILFTSPRHAPETKQRLQQPLQIAEQHWQQQGDEHKLGEVFAFRSLVDWLQGDFRDSFSCAREALARLPESDRQWRGISLIMLAVAEMLDGDLHATRQAITEALARCEAAQNIFGTLDSMLLLGEICTLQGELQQAETIFEQVLARVEDAPMGRNQAAIRRGRAMLGCAVLALERNDLEVAEEAATQAAAARDQFPEEDLLCDSPIVLAQVKFTRGESEEVQRILGTLVTGHHRSFLFRFPDLVRARLALASGDLATAQRLALADGPPQKVNWPVRRQQKALLLARLQIARGEGIAALPQLEQWRAEARANGQTRREIETKIVLALGHAAAGDGAQARKALIAALALAQPAAHRRIFLDEGPPLARLLQDVLPEIAEEALAAYARALLYTYAQEQSGKESPTDEDAGLFVEPLTGQEQRVLRLLAAGLSNPQIAGELVISVNTVKTHLKNVYGKLGVSSRDEAREAAQQLKLL